MPSGPSYVMHLQLLTANHQDSGFATATQPCARTGISYKSHQHAVPPALLVPVKETILAESQLLGSYRYSIYPLATASPVWTSDTSFHARPFRPA